MGRLVPALVGFPQVRDIAVKPPDKLIRFELQLYYQRLVAVHFVLAGVEIINQLVNRTAGHTAELYVFLIMPAAMSFRNVIVNRNGCPPHLVGQRIFFRGWKLLDEKMYSLSEFSRDFVKLEVVKSKTSLFHFAVPVWARLIIMTTHHSPLTTHHSPLTTHYAVDFVSSTNRRTICLALIPSAWAANVVMRRCVKTGAATASTSSKRTM